MALEGNAAGARRVHSQAAPPDTIGFSCTLAGLRVNRTPPICAAVALLGALLPACSSNKSQPEKYSAEAIATDPDVPIGSVVNRLDTLLLQWNQALVGRPDTRNLSFRHNLVLEIAKISKQRFDDLKHELESGAAVRNRAVIAAAIGFTKEQTALNPLISALNDPDPLVRENALIGIAQLADINTPVDLVADRLRPEESVQSQVNAGVALMRLADAGAKMDPILPNLRLALRNPNDAVKTHAAYALGAAKDTHATLELMGLVKNPGSRALVAAAAANALGKIGEPSAAPVLIEALGSPEMAVREEARRALKRLAGDDLGAEAGPWRRWLQRGESRPQESPASRAAGDTSAR